MVAGDWLMTCHGMNSTWSVRSYATQPCNPIVTFKTLAIRADMHSNEPKTGEIIFIETMKHDGFEMEGYVVGLDPP